MAKGLLHKRVQCREGGDRKMLSLSILMMQIVPTLCMLTTGSKLIL